MSTLRRTFMSGSVFFLALAIGHVMQHGSAIAERLAPVGEGQTLLPVNETDAPAAERIIDISSEPVDLSADPDMPVLSQPQGVRMPRAVDLGIADRVAAQNGLSPYGLACDLTLEALPQGASVVQLTLSAPCHPGAVATLTHGDLRFTDVTSADGTLILDVPALTPQAQFQMTFGDGVSIATDVTVPEAGDYQHVALMWSGAHALSLNAYEFGAAPGSSGHVHAGQPYVPARSINLGAGFLSQLGRGAARAEIYSVPITDGRHSGDIALTVAATVTDATCGTRLRAQTLDSAIGRPVTFSLSIPDCGAVGDVLVLKNLLRPVKVAAH